MTGFLTLQDLGHGMGEGEGGEPGRVPYRPLMPPTILQSNDFFMRMKFLSIFCQSMGARVTQVLLNLSMHTLDIKVNTFLIFPSH